MNELIKLSDDGNGNKLVSARELYDFLGFASQHWAKWYKKNIVNDIYFEKNKDYTQLPLSGSNKSVDFALTINMSKEISMLARTEKGKQARQYFIYCEERLNQVSIPSYVIENPIERAKAWIVEQEQVLLLQEKNEKLQYRSDFVDVCFDADGVFNFGEVSKILKLGYGSITLYKKMREYGLIMADGKTPYQKYVTNGYFKVVENLIENGKFKKLVTVTYATQKGIGYIKKLLDNNEK